MYHKLNICDNMLIAVANSGMAGGIDEINQASASRILK